MKHTANLISAILVLSAQANAIPLNEKRDNQISTIPIDNGYITLTTDITVNEIQYTTIIDTVTCSSDEPSLITEVATVASAITYQVETPAIPNTVTVTCSDEAPSVIIETATVTGATNNQVGTPATPSSVSSTSSNSVTVVTWSSTSTPSAAPIASSSIISSAVPATSPSAVSNSITSTIVAPSSSASASAQPIGGNYYANGPIFGAIDTAAPPAVFPREPLPCPIPSGFNITGGPIPTNKFHVNMYLSDQMYPIYSQPYSIWWSNTTGFPGMAISHTDFSQRVS